MPALNNKVPGDIFYPDYSRIKTTVANGAVTKGHIYSFDSAGHIQTGTKVNTDILDVTTGMCQAMHDAKDNESVQVLMPGSRIGVEAAASLHIGTPVQYDASNSEVKHIDGGASGKAEEYLERAIGRVFEVYTKDNIAVDQPAAADGEIVIVELGMR